MRRANHKALELSLRKIVERLLEEGWLLDSAGGNGFINEEAGSCCLVGAIGINHGFGPELNSFSIQDHLTDRSGIGIRALASLEEGFDGGVLKRFCGVKHTDRRALQIGARIRRDYCEFTNE